VSATDSFESNDHATGVIEPHGQARAHEIVGLSALRSGGPRYNAGPTSVASMYVSVHRTFETLFTTFTMFTEGSALSELRELGERAQEFSLLGTQIGLISTWYPSR
jgi:hypothetical protein